MRPAEPSHAVARNDIHCRQHSRRGAGAALEGLLAGRLAGFFVFSLSPLGRFLIVNLASWVREVRRVR